MIKLKKKRPRGRKRRPRALPDYLGEHFTILVDSGEVKQITFPPTMRWAPSGKRSALLTLGRRRVNLGRLEHSRGDYSLEGYTHVVAIERKGKISELVHNIATGKLDRQLRVLSSLVKHPYLLLEIPLCELYGTGGNATYRENDPTPCVLDAVMPLAHRHNVQILCPVSARTLKARTILGEYLVRVMLSHIKGETYVPYRHLQV